MKKFSIVIITIALALVGAQSCIAQAKLFKSAAGIKGVTSIYISPTMLKLGASFSDLGHGLDEAVSDLKALEIITCEEENKLPHVKETCQQVISSLGGELLLEVNEDDEHVVIYGTVPEGETYAEELVIEVSDEDDGEYTVIYLKGKIDMAQIAEQYQ